MFAPMTASGVVGAALIVFVFTLGFYVTPAILGGGRAASWRRSLVWLRMFQSPDWGLGAAISVALVVLVGRPHGRVVPAPARPALMGSSGRSSAQAGSRFCWLAFGLSLPARAAAGGRADLVHARAFPHHAEWPSVAHPLSRADRRSGLGAQHSLEPAHRRREQRDHRNGACARFLLGVWMIQPRFAALMVGFVLLPMIAPPIVSAMTLYFFPTSLSGRSAARSVMTHGWASRSRMSS